MAVNLNFKDIAVVFAIYDKDMENAVVPFLSYQEQVPVIEFQGHCQPSEPEGGQLQVTAIDQPGIQGQKWP